MTPAEIALQRGHTFLLLAHTQPRYVPAAIEHLRAAVDGYGPTYARSRAATLPELAGSYFRIGELDSAVTIGHEAVTEIGTLCSNRAYAKLRTLAATAAPFGHDSGAAELRERIRDALATAPLHR